MARVVGPLFSLEAHGSIGECLTYQDINGKPIVKALRFPTYRRSDAQGVVRDTFSWCSHLWAIMHEPKKDEWRAWKDAKGLVSYASYMNYMLRRTHLLVWQFEVPPDTGFCIVGNHLVAEFGVGGGYMTPGI